jgi:hypothetical protein
VKKARLLLALLAGAVALPATAADPEAPVADRTLLVSALDEKNQPIAALAVSEVAVLRRGVALEVVALEPETRPLELAVLVDTSAAVGSAFRLNVVEAVTALLRALPPGSRTAIWTTGDRPMKILEGPTDVAAAERALKRTAPRGGNRLLDALVEAVAAQDHKEGERSAVVAVSGLGLGFTGTDRRQVVERVAPSGSVVYGLTFDEGRAPGSIEEPDSVGGSDYEYVLGELAEKTGGSFESALSSMGLKDRLARIGSALAASYRLTYRAPAGVGPRDIEISVARPGVKVLRPGRRG